MHISELAPHRVGKVADVVKLGDNVKVKVLGFDDRGKVKLSMRQVDQQTGEDLGNRRVRSRPGRRNWLRDRALTPIPTAPSGAAPTFRAAPVADGPSAIGRWQPLVPETWICRR